MNYRQLIFFLIEPLFFPEIVAITTSISTCNMNIIPSGAFSTKEFFTNLKGGDTHMAFETFTGRKTVTNEPKVSILKQGNFNFNNGASKLLSDMSVTHLQMLYDADKKKIGFKPCDKGEPGAYKLRTGKGGAQLSGMAFLKHFQIPYKTKTTAFTASWDNKLKMLVISL
jgi:hypothetical protein